MKLAIYISVFVLTILIFSSFKRESGQYPENPAVSDMNGRPGDSLIFYFPVGNNRDSGFVHSRGDDFLLNWYSSALYSFKEPILYNYYLGKDIYRFLWLRSFHRPVVFSIVKTDSQVSLITKMLNRQPDFYDERYDPRGWNGLDEELKGRNVIKYGDTLVVVKADRKADIVYSKEIQLTLTQWKDFVQLLQKINYSSLPSVFDRNERGMDGSEWIVEAHLQEGYRYVQRWGPNELRSAGVYLINLSGLNEKIY
jgi:hypothetical protein